MILEKDLEVTENSSCGLYVPGKPMEHHTMKAKEAGFIKDTQVRCENCYYASPEKQCLLFRALNFQKDKFDLDTKIKMDACCNAWVPK